LAALYSASRLTNTKRNTLVKYGDNSNMTVNRPTSLHVLGGVWALADLHFKHASEPTQEPHAHQRAYAPYDRHCNVRARMSTCTRTTYIDQCRRPTAAPPSTDCRTSFEICGDYALNCDDDSGLCKSIIQSSVSCTCTRR
jgi:hypothetical protein